MFSKLVFAGFTRCALGALALLASSSGVSLAQEAELNLYSARHYATDEALYADFTRATGIRINRVDADDAGILSRLNAEGSSSPADVILLVDTARLWKGEVEGLFKPIHSKLLEKAIPEHLRARTRTEGTSWFGFSTRARVIVYDKSRVKPEDVDSYEKLALPVNKNKLCARSGSHPYNLSLFGSMLEHLGAPATEVWLKELVGNMARTPKGGDTDQIKAVGSGECGIALANSYYVARLLRSGAQQDQALMQRVGVIFPNQASWGTHMNIAGGAVAQYAKHPANAQKFLEYLASPSAQSYFADGNNEWPVVKGVQINNPALQAMGGVSFKTDPLPASFIGMNQIKVQQMLDRVGFR
jgi:iron(III) transport system substrate-binding protein